MFATLVLIAMYGSSFLPLLVLTLARVGKCETWILTGLALLWLTGMAWLHGQLFPAMVVSSPGQPWLIAGGCAGTCVLWAGVLCLLKKPDPIPRSMQRMRS